MSRARLEGCYEESVDGDGGDVCGGGGSSEGEVEEENGAVEKWVVIARVSMGEGASIQIKEDGAQFYTGFLFFYFWFQKLIIH